MRVVISSIVASAHLTVKYLAAWSASKFAATENESVFEHASGLKIVKECRDGLIHGIGIASMTFFQTRVLVPKISITGC